MILIEGPLLPQQLHNFATPTGHYQSLSGKAETFDGGSYRSVRLTDGGKWRITGMVRVNSPVKLGSPVVGDFELQYAFANDSTKKLITTPSVAVKQYTNADAFVYEYVATMEVTTLTGDSLEMSYTINDLGRFNNLNTSASIYSRLRVERIDLLEQTKLIPNAPIRRDVYEPLDSIQSPTPEPTGALTGYREYSYNDDAAGYKLPFFFKQEDIPTSPLVFTMSDSYVQVTNQGPVVWQLSIAGYGQQAASQLNKLQNNFYTEVWYTIQPGVNAIPSIKGFASMDKSLTTWCWQWLLTIPPQGSLQFHLTSQGNQVLFSKSVGHIYAQQGDGLTMPGY